MDPVSEKDLSLEEVISTLQEGYADLPWRVQKEVQYCLESVHEKVARRLPVPASSGALQHEFRRVLKRKAMSIEFNRHAEGLLRDLEDAGFVVETPWDLRVPGVDGTDAVPILLKWLHDTEYRDVKLAIMAPLDMKWAAPAVIGPLFTEFHRVDPAEDQEPNGVRWGILNVLKEHATPAWMDDFVAIASDPRSGDSRELAIDALARLSSRREQLTPLMLQFLNSDEESLYRPAAAALARWKVAEARPRIQYLIDTAEERNAARPLPKDEVEWERDELRKAFMKILPKP